MVFFLFLFFYFIFNVGILPNTENNRKHFWGLLPNILMCFIVIIQSCYLILNIDFINKNKDLIIQLI